MLQRYCIGISPMPSPSTLQTPTGCPTIQLCADTNAQELAEIHMIALWPQMPVPSPAGTHVRDWPSINRGLPWPFPQVWWFSRTAHSIQESAFLMIMGFYKGYTSGKTRCKRWRSEVCRRGPEFSGVSIWMASLHPDAFSKEEALNFLQLWLL